MRSPKPTEEKSRTATVASQAEMAHTGLPPVGHSSLLFQPYFGPLTSVCRTPPPTLASKNCQIL